jgi:predicted MFS family arabinose efflux permease
MRPSVPTRWFLTVVLGGQFMANMDNAIVNVATPAIGATLHASGPQLQFTVSGYVLASALLLIASARCGSIFGYRPLFLAGLATFTLASLACGLAPDVVVLIAARVVQGIGAALMVAQVLSAIQLNLAGPARLRAIGAFTMTLSASAVAGQLLGGSLVSANLFGASWRPIFLINVPIGIALFALALRALPSHAPGAPGRRSGPLVDLRLFAVRGVPLRIAALACTRITYFALLFVVALYLQDGRGWSAFASGFALVAWVAAYGVAGPIVPRLPPRLARWAALAGCLVMAAAFLGLTVASTATAPAAALVLLLAAGGFGFGASSTALVSHLTAGVPTPFASDLSGVLATLGPAAATLGVVSFGGAYLRIAPHGGPGAAYAFAVVCAAFAVLCALAAAAVATVEHRITGTRTPDAQERPANPTTKGRLRCGSTFTRTTSRANTSICSTVSAGSNPGPRPDARSCTPPSRPISKRVSVSWNAPASVCRSYPFRV